MKKPINEMKLSFMSMSANESFARSAVAAFAAQLDPTIDELSDIKTAVSEAVTNCIVHAYPDTIGLINISAKLYSDNAVFITIRDKGVGIADVQKALEPQFTTSPGEERSGIGFSVMSAFMDEVKVRSVVQKGTAVSMKKRISQRAKR